MKHPPRVRTVRKSCGRCSKPCIRPEGLCASCARLVPRSTMPDRDLQWRIIDQPIRWRFARAQRVKALAGD